MNQRQPEAFAPLEEAGASVLPTQAMHMGLPQTMGLVRLSCQIKFHGDVEGMSPPLVSQPAGDIFTQQNVVGVTPWDVWGSVTTGHQLPAGSLHMPLGHSLSEPSFQDGQSQGRDQGMSGLWPMVPVSPALEPA